MRALGARWLLFICVGAAQTAVLMHVGGLSGCRFWATFLAVTFIDAVCTASLLTWRRIFGIEETV